jgi:hypothetical protein
MHAFEVKTIMTTRPINITILAMSILLVAARAQADFVVTLDTSPLSGPQTLVLGLTNFDPASNTVSLSSFSFDGGTVVPGSEDCTLGGTFSRLGCSGDLASGVTLQDLDAFVFFTQQFNPGSSVSFVLNTTNAVAGLTPDQFGMFLCDVSFNCYSDDASGALLLLDLAGGPLSPSSFVLFGATLQNLEAPVVAAVPEPGTLLLVSSGLIGVMASGRRYRP